MPISLQAEEVNYISYDINTSVVSKIDKFFTEKPQKTNVIWTPKINGRSRYAFSIPKDAYLISKKHSDSSELYYLSEIIDRDLDTAISSLNRLFLRYFEKSLFLQHTESVFVSDHAFISAFNFV